MSVSRDGVTSSGGTLLKRLIAWSTRSTHYLYRYRPRFHERAFWVVQGLIIVIAVMHDYGESVGLLTQLGALYFLTLSLFFVPLVYAALHFGFVGSLATAMWVMIVTIPDWLFWHHALDERLGVILSLAIVNGLSIFVGQRIDREKTARQNAESSGAALKVSEIKYRNLFESSPVPVLVLDSTGAILETNPAANRLFDIQMKTGQKGHLTDLIGERNARKLIDSPEADEQSAETFSIKLDDGSNIRLKPTLTQLVDGQDDTVIQAVLRDVTDEYNRQVGLREYAASVTRTQEDERQRIARELHDETIQSLILLCRQLDSAETYGEDLPLSVTTELSEARKTAASVVTGLREFTTSLRPPALDDLGIITAIRRLVREHKDRSGIDTRLEVSGEYRKMTSDTELGIFRIAQEALSNAARHSGATGITVILSYTETEVKLEVSDNGTGFSLPSATTDFTTTPHLGIIGMQERAGLFGGKLRIQSSPGTGTKVTASVRISGTLAEISDSPADI
ncbi:MAG: PAS domain-containing sensor histidine kinase [Dehalococcoidales bacterium]